MEIHAVFEPTVQHPYGYVYVTHDVVNNKYYCGKHKSSAFDTAYYGSGILLKKSLQQHPPSNFICVPIDWAETAEELHQKEVQWIQHYNAVDDPMWYNMIEDSNRHVQTNEEQHKMMNYDFTLLYNKTFSKVLKLGLKNSELSVFLYMTTKMNYGNYVQITTKSIAKDLNYNEQIVCRAIAELLRQELIVRNPEHKFNHFMVNPYYVYRGLDRNKALAIFEEWKQAQKDNSQSEPGEPESLAIRSHKKKRLHIMVQKSKERGNNAKQRILDYLTAHRNEQNEVHATLNDIIKETHISRMTVIKFLQYLVELGFICKPKNGVIQMLYDWD